LHHTFFDDEKAHSLGAFLKHMRIVLHGAVEHFLCYVLDLCLTEVVEDEMILKAAEEKGHLLIFLLLFLKNFFLELFIEL
jgi:hypothetical protein